MEWVLLALIIAFLAPEFLVLILLIPLIFLEFLLRLFGKSFDDDQPKES